jgi:predicted nuclease with TOPRIM domain
MSDAELDRLVERNNRYIASLRGENELNCGNGMASFALEESTTAITALRARIAEDQAQIAALTTYRENLRDEVIELRARIAELEVEVEVANDPSPYCPICGSCGEDGCCSAQRCLYSDDKLMARIAELEAFRQQAIKQVCELAREAGEAKGKLEASELPGIVDDWREKCERLERRVAELEAERAEWVEVERLRMGKPTPPTPPA